ncbi:MAG: NADH-quinone oxidoreductase subunit J [Candidatus Sericytochromatia bacterium]
MLADTVFFMIFSTVAIASAVIMITRKHPLSAAVSLVVTFISLSGLYALLSAKLLFIIQILVYAGAIMTLVIFSIMLLNVQEEDLPNEGNIAQKTAFSVFLLIPILLLILKAVSIIPTGDFPVVTEKYSDIHEIGIFLFTKYTFPFEVVSILLLISLVGSVVLAKRKI